MGFLQRAADETQDEPAEPSAGLELRLRLLASFERWTELPLLFMALLLIPILLLPSLMNVSPGLNAVLNDASWFIWAAFAIEYVVRLSLTDKKLKFVLREWPDLLIILLPFIRPLRIVRSARALRLLRLFRVVVALSEINQETRRILTRKGLHYAVALGIITIVLSAAFVASVERNANGNIRSFSDALWWACTTVTTVGYGDRYPVTSEGRGIAVFLMVVGITIFGFLTANIASYMIESGVNEDESEPKMSDLLARIDGLSSEIVSLRITIDDLQGHSNDKSS